MRTGPAALAAEVARAARGEGAARTLIVDLDGTLSPIAPAPGLAVVPPRARDALRRLARRGWRIVLSSGRPARQARRMVGIARLRVFGSHGLEELERDGRYKLRLPREAAARLAALLPQARELARGEPGVRLEIKPAGLAIHDRGVPPGRLVAWHERLDAFLDGSSLAGLEALPGKRVLELRPRAAGKGAVVRRVAREAGVRRRDASFVALGDDTTDEAMFAAIRPLGLGVHVGSRDLPTRATRRLRSPAAVATFLERLATTEGGGR